MDVVLEKNDCGNRAHMSRAHNRESALRSVRSTRTYSKFVKSVASACLNLSLCEILYLLHL